MPRQKNNVEETEGLEKVVTQSDDALVVENKELKNRLSKLEEMFLALTQQMQEKSTALSPTSAQIEPQEEVIPEIPMGKIIKVVSLFNGGLNLKTSDHGDARVYRFEELGQIYPIIYADLVQILSNQRRFFTEGYCMILDKNVVKAHALEEIYKKMVDDKTIKNILKYDAAKIREIVSGLMPTVQQTIIETVVSIINKNEYFDKSKVDIISSVTGKDIFAIAQRMK